VFEVPTTLDALHDMIATHASNGSDVSLIIQRIHATNSVRLNHKNKERMQNFYDVLLRRFVAVGDEIFNSGNGGPDLERYEQLNSLTNVLYAMSQDSPECAGAVWNRRLGVFHKAHSKRLRDVEINPLGDACEGEFSAWPSTGMLLLMRALPHIFPSTDKRHAVVSPALILLGQILVQTPVKTQYDVVIGLFCSGLMLEYTKDAKRLPPESLVFLAGVLRLFADDSEEALANSPLPSFGTSNSELGNSLRKQLSRFRGKECVPLSLEKSQILSEVMKALLCIDGSNKDLPLPASIKTAIAETAHAASKTCPSGTRRRPLQRRKAASAKELAIKTLAPRMEDPDRYNMSKDKGKSHLQAQHDRQRREYKREHKAAMRELRIDNAFIENERRKTKDEADGKAREKRHKNFAWMEMEQATMNQQVRLGGGLLSGGGKFQHWNSFLVLSRSSYVMHIASLTII
jgi:nucleolar protein 14